LVELKLDIRLIADVEFIIDDELKLFKQEIITGLHSYARDFRVFYYKEFVVPFLQYFRH
jgi:hypothetical protein